MPKFQDLTGKQFGDLRVIGLGERYANGKIAWECKCKCGRIVRRITFDLTHSRHPCCLSCSSKKSAPTTHKMTGTKLYYVWAGIKARCYNPNNKSFHNYGGRGITMCDEWRSDFMSFHDWAIANGYKEGLSIDRINVGGNYEPSNCRWSTDKEQSRNRRDNIFLEHNGETKILSDWADEYGIDRNIAVQRYSELKNRGKPFDFNIIFHKGRLDAKAVSQYSLDGLFIKSWPCIAEAGRNGYDATSISMCCNGKRISANGYLWRFESE